MAETDDETRLRELIALLEKVAALAQLCPPLDILASDFSRAASIGRHILSGEHQS